MRTTWTIAKREFRSNFDSPLAYVIICLTLVVLSLVFFYDGFWQKDRATMQGMFTRLPQALIFIAPIVTMRLLAEERRSGTLEMLITLPVKDHEVILGKFLGAWSLVLVLIGSTLLFPIAMFKWPWHLGQLDWGPVIGGYLGLMLHSAAAVALGLLVSALTESQVIAGFVSVALLFLLHLSGFVSLDSIGVEGVRDVVTFASFHSRFEPFTRGMINTRDVVYFASITVLALMASFTALERRKWA